MYHPGHRQDDHPHGMALRELVLPARLQGWYTAAVLTMFSTDASPRVPPGMQYTPAYSLPYGPPSMMPNFAPPLPPGWSEHTGEYSIVTERLTSSS